jgi:addiction module HigA family antidote
MIENTLPMHPGEVLSSIYMSEMKLTQVALAKLCGCTSAKVNEIVNKKRSITPAFAIKLEEVIGTDAKMWVRMQADYDLWEARQKVA